MSDSMLPCEMPCAKCGYAGVSRVFRGTASSWSIAEYGKARNKFASASSYLATAFSDHIDHTCQCCGYRWQTRPLSKRRKATHPSAADKKAE
jgi:hypothetical protein